MIRHKLRVEEAFRSAEINRPLSLWARIEHFAWGALVWRLAIHSLEQRIEQLIDRVDERGKKLRRRLRAYCFFLFRLEDYGRLLSRAARKQIRKLRNAGASKSLIRDAVIGRLLHLKTGELCLKERRSRMVLALGICWHVLATVSAALLLTLVIALPAPPIEKFLVSALLVLSFLYSIAFINALTIRPHFSLPTLAALCDAMKPQSSLRLWAVD